MTTIKSDKYWEQRALMRENHYQRDSNRTIGQVRKAYETAYGNIEAEVRKIQRIAEKLPDDELEPYSARLQRYNALQMAIDEEVERLAKFETGVTKARYAEVIQDAYNRTMFDVQQGVGFKFPFATLQKKAIQATLTTKWVGHKTFSQRIWRNTHFVTKQAKEVIQGGLLAGTTNRDMVKQLMALVGTEATETAKFNATRLIRTETNYFANQGELASYEEADIEKYKYIATLDKRTSCPCQSLDNQVFKIAKENIFMVCLKNILQKITALGGTVGKNYPPMHPFCRSTTIAVIDGRTEQKLKRSARDPKTGKTYLVPADMNYEEWAKSVGLK